MSAVVRRFLIEFASEGTEFDRLKRQEDLSHGQVIDNLQIIDPFR